MSLPHNGILPTGTLEKPISVILSSPLLLSFPFCLTLPWSSLNSFRQIFCVQCKMLPVSQFSLWKIGGFNLGKIILFICCFKYSPCCGRLPFPWDTLLRCWDLSLNLEPKSSRGGACWALEGLQWQVRRRQVLTQLCFPASAYSLA